jgi:butyryl-CoA dehydrogenase
MKDFNNKVVVITGAGSGIGKELAKAFHQKGARLALNDWNAETLEETRQSLGDSIYTSAFDVSQRKEMDSFAGQVQDQFGQVDIVINNAGMTLPPVQMEYIKESDFRKVIEVNLWGVIYGTFAFLPFLKTRNEAALVNMSSVFGLMGSPLQGPYSISKFGVRAFTETLRNEMKKSSVTVSSVYPAGIKTNIVWNIEGMDAEDQEKMAQVFDNMSKTTSEQAARIILKGIQKKKARILVGKGAQFIDRVVRLLPSRYENILLRKLRSRES